MANMEFIPNLPFFDFFGVNSKFDKKLFYDNISLVIFMSYSRNIKEAFLEYSNMFKAVLLTGLRQVGKTTFLLSIKEAKRNYVTLDDLNVRAKALSNPEEFFNIYKPPIIIDEIQYAPKLMSYIKIICDNSKENGLFWITGSQKIGLMKGVSETLAGRMGVLEMNSFAYREIVKSKYLPVSFDLLTAKEYIDKSVILKNILNGGMPGFVLQDMKREYYFKSYINLYLERDKRFKCFLCIFSFNCF